MAVWQALPVPKKCMLRKHRARVCPSSACGTLRYSHDQKANEHAKASQLDDSTFDLGNLCLCKGGDDGHRNRFLVFLAGFPFFEGLELLL
jgi:hypothetical protein